MTKYAASDVLANLEQWVRSGPDGAPDDLVRIGYERLNAAITDPAWERQLTFSKISRMNRRTRESMRILLDGRPAHLPTLEELEWLRSHREGLTEGGSGGSGRPTAPRRPTIPEIVMGDDSISGRVETFLPRVGPGKFDGKVESEFDFPVEEPGELANAATLSMTSAGADSDAIATMTVGLGFHLRPFNVWPGAGRLSVSFTHNLHADGIISGTWSDSNCFVDTGVVVQKFIDGSLVREFGVGNFDRHIDLVDDTWLNSYSRNDRKDGVRTPSIEVPVSDGESHFVWLWGSITQFCEEEGVVAWAHAKALLELRNVVANWSVSGWQNQMMDNH